MFPRGARVLCAVSGGADSMCLLTLLCERAAELGIEVAAAHYEHGLRGEESLRDRDFAAARCRALGLPFVAESGDAAAFARERKLGIEEAARTLRYAFLERAADSLGCSRIATGHNADDNAETLLLNLVRGSGTRGLGGIPPRRGRLIRPLLKTPRSDIEAYLREREIPWVEDSSNGSDDYLRNRLRRRVIPLLREENPALSAALGRTAELLRRDEDFLSGLAADWIDAHLRGGSVPAAELLALEEPLSSRVLRALCPQSLSAAQTELALRFAEGTERGLLDLPGLRLRREQGRLFFIEEEQAPAAPPRPIRREGDTELPELGLTVRAERGPAESAEIHSQFKTCALNCEKIKGDLICTARRPGDRLRPAGRGVSKTLKQLFLEAGMTQAERDRTPILRDEEGVLAAVGLAVDERVAAAPGEDALRLRFIPNKVREKRE